MNEILYWYLIGVAACIPFAFYYTGMMMVRKAGLEGGFAVRFLGFMFYLFLCVFSWVMLGIDLLVFIFDMAEADKIRRKEGMS